MRHLYRASGAVPLPLLTLRLAAPAQGYANSWMVSVSWVDVSTSSPVYQWYAAVYWMIVTVRGCDWGRPVVGAEQMHAERLASRRGPHGAPSAPSSESHGPIYLP